MARSARASVIKRNSSNLRRRVFAPADQARTERLSAKLVALAQKPKPEKLLEEMEIESKLWNDLDSASHNLTPNVLAPKGDEAAAAEVEQNGMQSYGLPVLGFH